MPTAPARTLGDRFPRVEGAGLDLVHRANAPEETWRLWVEGDAFPRVVIDIPGAQILVGDGTALPIPLSGGGGGGAPTNATYITMTASAGLSAEVLLANVIRRDVVANRGAFGNPGVIFIATDTQLAYRDSGAAWDLAFPVLDGTGKIVGSVLPNTAATPGAFGNASTVPIFTVAADGRLTASSSTPIQIAESQVTSLVADLAAIAVSLATKALPLVPTAVKTASPYNAAAQDFVPCDTTSNAITVNLPSAPADKTQVGVKHVIQGGSNVVTINTGGTDVINRAGGATAATLPVLAESLIFQYQASTGIWYIVEHDAPRTAQYFEALAALSPASLVDLQTQTALQAAQVEVRRIADLGQFVCSGLLLTPNATPTKLDMAAGTQFAGTTELNATAQAAIATTIASLEHATLPKWVSVELNGSNVVVFNQGTAAAAPAMPTITPTNTPLALLYVPSSAVNTAHQVDTAFTTPNGLAKLIDVRNVRAIHLARLLFTDVAATSVALTSGVAASLLASTYTLPLNSLNVGDTIIIEGSFRYINTVNASTLLFKILNTTSNFVQYTIPSMPANANARWGTFRITIVVKAIGTSTGFNVEIESNIVTSLPSASTPAANFDTASGGTNGGLDTTVNQVFDLTVQSSAASSTVALRAFTIYKIPA